MSRSKSIRISRAAIAFILILYLLCLPRDFFKNIEYSTVVLDRNGELLGARIASDGQWRFPPCDTVPIKYKTALIQFEDKYFNWHLGVNPFAIARAASKNIKSGHITSGGSTISMQIVRMSRRKTRNLWQKVVEAVLATRLEMRYSKNKILAIYASHAPFGGNVVGIEAASWRYFGRPAKELSWGEAATLAVLPNSPSIIHPGKNRERLLKKRNRLLEDMYKAGKIDYLTCQEACAEPLPRTPLPLPGYAPHLVEWYLKKTPGATVITDIDIHLQQKTENIIDRWNSELSASGIRDLAAIVIESKTGKIVAYCGNANQNIPREGNHVDILRSPRSTGSILKPLLYCAMLQEGQILPYSIIPDLPININGFSPQNYDMQFNGAVPASEALARSLNVPAVNMLRIYGVAKFKNLLESLGMTTLNRDANDYGLSLILGGAEGTLIDITSIYSALSKTYQSKNTGDFPLNDRTALWYTFDALKEVGRPDEIDWKLISSIKKIAWKTGTSYGFRDAWAIGVTPEYSVGVWAGNANGEGVPGLTGARTSGPVMFDIFNILPYETENNKYSCGGWFKEPVYGEYILAEVCRESGFLKGPACEKCDTLMLSRLAERSETCPYHRFVNGKSSFILPPAMEWYYRKLHPGYQPVRNGIDSNVMEFIYPESGSTIYIPKQLDGKIKGAIFNLAHRNPSSTVFWHLDNQYIGETRFIHRMTILPTKGRHTVTVVDEKGNSLSLWVNTISEDYNTTTKLKTEATNQSKH